MKKLKVLFVGNSYTYFNEMPKEIFTKVAAGADVEAEVTQITKGGHRLCQFADPCDEHGARLREAINGSHYDYAVLQEQSHTPISNEAQFMEGTNV